MSRSNRDWTNNFDSLPADPIMAARAEYVADKRKNKINAGIGMIFDFKKGLPFIPSVVLETSKKIGFSNTSYQGSSGSPEFLYLNGKHLVFGEDLWDELYGKDQKKPASMVWAQTLGGTNALYLAKEILQMSTPDSKRILYLDPGWPNHPNIFKSFEIKTYEHVDPETNLYNHQNLMQSLKKAPAGAAVLLQVCGYNDDGADREPHHWNQLAEVIDKRKLIPILDFAYNGLARGFGKDNYPVTLFAKKGITTFICVSNSKNVGYNLRLGALYIINLEPDKAAKIQQNLENKIIRTSYSNPPGLPPQVMSVILKDPKKRKKYMDQIERVRKNVLEHNRNAFLKILGPQYQWISTRHGIFMKLKTDGFTDKQYKFLKEKNAIHGPKSSRINLGGFDPKKVAGFVKIYKKALSL